MSQKLVSPVASFGLVIGSVVLIVGGLFSTYFTPVSAGPGEQSELLGPPGSGEFGHNVIVLPNGNIIVSDPLFDAGDVEDAGAVYLYDGETLELISRLTGSSANDSIGSFFDLVYIPSIEVLPNSNFVVLSRMWDRGDIPNAGAVTLCNGVTGCSGEVSPENSLVGSKMDDQVGIIRPLTNGNYLVYGDHGAVGGAGTVTWCDGMDGCTGEVSVENSLVGSSVNDMVGFWIKELDNGNYIVISPYWDNGAATDAGAVTWCNGMSGCSGEVSPSNSLVGSTSEDQIGRHFYYPDDGTFLLPNGNYLVSSSSWDNGAIANAGAVTWCNGLSGCTGEIGPANSLVGTHPTDRLGEERIVILSDNDYVIGNPRWDNGAFEDAGAVTWCNGTGGCIGEVSPANSLVGNHTFDDLGGSGYISIFGLTNGSYVVGSKYWDNGTAYDAGAATWCPGDGSCVGEVSPANSLVGTQLDDHVGENIVQELENGNYVVRNHEWDNGAVVDAGALTFCSSLGGCVGEVSPVNSLVGTHPLDNVGYRFIETLSNGNYLVPIPTWDNGLATDAGAVTFCSGVSGCTGEVSAANSLVGSHTNDKIYVTYVLDSGNYLAGSQDWDNGEIVDAGAIAWCDGTSGCVGEISPSTSLVGTHPSDSVGFIDEIGNGIYLIASPYHNDDGVRIGAVTWCSGIGGCTGEITTTNSLIGTHIGFTNPVITILPNGNYLILNANWHDENNTVKGALFFCPGQIGCVGETSLSNGLFGPSEFIGFGRDGISILPDGNFLLSSWKWPDGSAYNNTLTWCNGTSGCTGIVNETNSLVGSGLFDIVQLGQENHAVFNWTTTISSATLCSNVIGCRGVVPGENSILWNTESYIYDYNAGLLAIGLPLENRVILARPMSFDFHAYLPIQKK